MVLEKQMDNTKSHELLCLGQVLKKKISINNTIIKRNREFMLQHQGLCLFWISLCSRSSLPFVISEVPLRQLELFESTPASFISPKVGEVGVRCRGVGRLYQKSSFSCGSLCFGLMAGFLLSVRRACLFGTDLK